MNSRLMAVCGAVLGLGVLASCSQGPSAKTSSDPKPAEAEASTPPPAPANPVEQAPAPKPAPPPPPPPPPTQKQPPPPAPQAAAPAKADKSAAAQDEAKDWFISLDRAKELYDKKEVNKRQVIFVDARTYNEFTEGHIRGAMCYSTKYTQGAPQAKLRNYLPGSAVVLYCHGELCTDSIDVGRYFQSLHMDIGPVFVIKDGMPGWLKAYPNLVDKGPEIGFD